MKKLFFLALFFVSLAGCEKPEKPAPDVPNVVPDPVTEGSIPPSEIISTRIAGLADGPDNTFYNNITLVVNELSQRTTVTGGAFITANLNTDRYATTLILTTPPDVEKYRTVALTPAALNYVRVKPFPVNVVSSLYNRRGGQFGFGNGGSLTIPGNAIYEQAHGPYYALYDPDINAAIRISYINPLSADFALSIPCYSMADDDNKRWFLASLGVVRLSAGTVWLPEDESQYDFYTTNNSTGTLKIPIPANVSALLPDSIPLWRLSRGRWVKSVTAKKDGNFYTATIRKMSAYNLAIPVKGVYRTVRLRTNAGTPILNATIKIKHKELIVAEAQTDWDGNALLFLPADENLTVEVYALSRQPGSVVHSAPVSTTTATKEINVTINDSLPRLFTFKGDAKACNGTPVTGEIILYNRVIRTVDFHIPVTNGRFNASIIDDYGGNLVFYAKLVDQVAGVTGSDTAFALTGGSANTYNFNTCPPETTLYMHYAVDGVSTSISGDLSHPTNPFLNASPTFNSTLISGSNNNGQGLQFSTNASAPGVYRGSGIGLFSINNKQFYSDVNKPMRVTFDRFDLQPGGVVIGSADFWYRDEANVQRNITASFRLRRSQ